MPSTISPGPTKASFSARTRGGGRIDWGDLYRWSEGRSSFLFWTTEQTYVYLPRRSLDGALVEDLRGTLLRFGPPRF